MAVVVAANTGVRNASVAASEANPCWQPADLLNCMTPHLKRVTDAVLVTGRAGLTQVGCGEHG